ncbi:MAG: Tex family protein [Desulfovibrionales bacterium]
MLDSHIRLLAEELDSSADQILAVAGLLENGGTVPFIARYRKEATGALDEVRIRTIRDRLEEIRELEKRRKSILDSLSERALLNRELKREIERAPTRTILEDIYLPYRPKRRTRAAIAREKGLAPLVGHLLDHKDFDEEKLAAAFVNPEKGVDTVDAALAGARDILAEQVAEDPTVRNKLRRFFSQTGEIQSSIKRGMDTDKDAVKYSDYFDWKEKAARAPGHRILAMFRGEREGYLSLSIRPDEEQGVKLCLSQFVRMTGSCREQVWMAVRDGYKRLLAPSLENEIRSELKKRADYEAIRIFVSNLRELLLAPPLGRRRIMALDPGFRTGAKLVCLDEQGQLLHDQVIFPTGSKKQIQEAAETVRRLTQKYSIQAVAVGNGTAGRETESFIRSLDLPGMVVVLVNESGASVYSASEIAREEFPDLDLTMRSAVSIGRRLMDPLAELVKIDPKSIGVGQYQHDVDQAALKRALDDTVVSCVNSVGVELNTASAALLSYVAGVGPVTAKNIETWRNANGPFRSRRDLLKVKRFGPKAFEQAAGFLRIRNGDNPLDASAVHPERYPLVEKMARDLKVSVAELTGDASLAERIELEQYVSKETGMDTLRDIAAELARPGRDPRPRFEPFSFAEGVNTLEDLEPGMILPGIVTNVTAFGAFIDVGVHQDGLAHVSQLADRFVKDPAEVVSAGMQVRVRVLEVDTGRKRISLSLKGVQ